MKQHLKTLCTLAVGGFAVGAMISTGLTGCSSTPVVERSPDAIADEPTPLAESTGTTPRNQKPYFNWPVDSARMTRGFLPNRRRPHLGIDLAAPKNTPIFAAHDGVVIYAGKDFRGYGRMVMIEGKKG